MHSKNPSYQDWITCYFVVGCYLGNSGGDDTGRFLSGFFRFLSFLSSSPSYLFLSDLAPSDVALEICTRLFLVLLFAVAISLMKLFVICSLSHCPPSPSTFYDASFLLYTDVGADAVEKARHLKDFLSSLRQTKGFLSYHSG